MSNEKEIIISRVNDYAKTINLAKTELIGDFYTDDALFIPDNYKSITARELKNNSRKGFLNKTDFTISYSAEDVVLAGDFAFVTAVAETSVKDSETKLNVLKTSQDFFVFKKVDNEWKIFRYLFNNVKIVA